MLAGLLGLCIVVLRFVPETPFARTLHKHLVEAPAFWLSSVKRRDIIFLIVVAVTLLAAGEFIAIFGAAEWLLVSANLSLYLDALLVTSAVAIVANTLSAWRATRAHVSTWRHYLFKGFRREAREARSRKTSGAKGVDDSEDPAGRFALAY